MTIPCTQEEPIREIKSNLDKIDSNVDRLCESNSAMIVEMRDMTEKLVTHMVENREHHVKITTLEKNSDIVFERVRRLEDDLYPAINDSLRKVESEVDNMSELPGKVQVLEEWNNKMKGVILVVPVTCTVISAIAAVAAIWISYTK